MKMVCMVLAVVGLASGAMAERKCRRPIEDVGEKQRQERLAIAKELCRSGDSLYYGRGCDRDLEAAARQYQKAADMGYARAEVNICLKLPR